MELTYEERIKRLEVASSIFEYAQLMEQMSMQPKRLIKNIYREKEQQYNVDKYSEYHFNLMKKHHYYNAVITAFSYIKEEYLDKLKLKDLDIEEKDLEGIFVNPNDIDMFKNHNPGQNNKLQINEIIGYIRNAFNHTENGVLYKYLEQDDSVEINLSNVGRTYDGNIKKFHVKIKLNLLTKIINKIYSNDSKKSNLFHVSHGVNCDTPNLFEELKNKTKVFRIISTKDIDYKTILSDILSNHETSEQKINAYINSGLIRAREYSYDNGGLTEDYINSIFEVLNTYKDDWRINYMFENIKQVNHENISEEAKKTIAEFLSTRNNVPFGIVAFDRYVSSLIFENAVLETWNYSFDRLLEKNIGKIDNLRKLNTFEWFMLDPVEKIYSEYEKFIRYSIINFAPLSNSSQEKPSFIEYNGKQYNCTFIRNAFAHGRIAYVKKDGNYMFELYDTPNGLSNETKYYEEGDFKPQLFDPTELVKFAEYLCISEKKKLDEEKNNNIKTAINNLENEMGLNQNIKLL